MPSLEDLNYAWLIGGFLSFGSLTFLFPLIAALFWPFSSTRSARRNPAGTIDLEILIPAYNESDTIEHTLKSVWSACRSLLEKRPDAKLKISVAIDGATDDTPAKAKAFAEIAMRELPSVRIEVNDRRENVGKWRTLSELAQGSVAHWSAMVDSGTLWPRDFLLRLADRLERSDAVGLAPGYEQGTGGTAERIVWWQERSLKCLENLAGGPFSLHGATMIFVSSDLKQAFAELNHRTWLNDDVVLGLALRSRGRIEYLGSELCVSDCGVRANSREFNRRQRMLLGNMEWIRELFPSTFLRAPVVGILAFRRIIRLFWAYILLLNLFFFGLFLNLSWEWLLLLMFVFTSPFLFNRRLRHAAWVSIRCPLTVIQKNSSISWG